MNTTTESEDFSEYISEKIIKAPSTPSSSSDYNTGDADDSSDSRGPVPNSLKALENEFSLNQVLKCFK